MMTQRFILCCKRAQANTTGVSMSSTMFVAMFKRCSILWGVSPQSMISLSSWIFSPAQSMKSFLRTLPNAKVPKRLKLRAANRHALRTPGVWWMRRPSCSLMEKSLRECMRACLCKRSSAALLRHCELTVQVLPRRCGRKSCQKHFSSGCRFFAQVHRKLFCTEVWGLETSSRQAFGRGGTSSKKTPLSETRLKRVEISPGVNIGEEEGEEGRGGGGGGEERGEGG